MPAEATHEQMALGVGPSCKARGCTRPVVGHSTTGKGHVCVVHNEREWGNALVRSRAYVAMGRSLLASATRKEGVADA